MRVVRGSCVSQVDSWTGSESPSSIEQEETVPSRDTMYELLSNQRRRYAIHYLKYQDESVPIGMLAERIAAWENEIPDAEVTCEQRKSAYTALQQHHLPKLDDAGLVSFNRQRGLVAPGDALDKVDIYTEVVQDGDFSWSQYYLGLSVVTGLVLGGVWAGVTPLTALPDIAWGIFCVTAFAVSAAVHFTATRGMKLGTDKQPPEVQDR